MEKESMEYELMKEKQLNSATALARIVDEITEKLTKIKNNPSQPWKRNKKNVPRYR